ncbi:hypothetical protein AAC387_Pa03g4455 [Persea americana]
MTLVQTCLAILLTFAVPVHAQPGFISINCGMAEDSTYIDIINTTYHSDAKYIETGVNYNLSKAFLPTTTLQQLYSNVRSFTSGSRNCYNLSEITKGTKYLLRVHLWQYKETPTRNQDVEAILDIKSTYQLKRNWMGDPCVPKNYSWEGLACNYTLSDFPTVLSLNLSSIGLKGEIAVSLANLISIQSLDLSWNNLIGPIPDFLGDLPSLSLLNLRGNQLNGSVPSNLVKKVNRGSLQLSIDNNPNLIPPVFDKKKSRKFTYAEVLSITNNLQRCIGKGGFGTVYHGQMTNGTQVAVKLLSLQSIKSPSQGSKEFQNEVHLLMRVHHRNLVPFIGYCQEDGNMALIYEYMARGHLGSHLSDNNSNALSWDRRLHIALDVAQGLEYLHNGCKPPIIHRDVKTANILLNERLEAKIGDFGLSKVYSDDFTHVSTAVKGTFGYLDPEYCNSNNLTEKSDVYSFGVVLLQLITGKMAIVRISDEDDFAIPLQFNSLPVRLLFFAGTLD